MEHRGRKLNSVLKLKVRKLAQIGASYQEIADTLGLKSRQLARYHFNSYPHVSEKVLDKGKVKE